VKVQRPKAGNNKHKGGNNSINIPPFTDLLPAFINDRSAKSGEVPNAVQRPPNENATWAHNSSLAWLSEIKVRQIGVK